MINLAAFVERSEVNGPGVRAVVWVQGCARETLCPGCYNPSFLDPRAIREPASPQALAARIAAIDGLDGVTFSGGEPFDQADALAETARPLRAAGLTLTVFSGHTLEELRAARRRDWDALLAETDLLVDGPYVAALASPHLPLRGSSNQRLHFLTGRILPAHLDAPREIELTIDAAGHVTGTGVIDPGLLAHLRRTRDR